MCAVASRCAHAICRQGRDAVRCFLPHAAVPTRARTSEVAGLMRAVEEKLLGGGVVGPEGGVSVIKRWPSKQKQQAAAVLWLALYAAPDTAYDEADVDWLIGVHYTRSLVRSRRRASPPPPPAALVRCRAFCVSQPPI